MKGLFITFEGIDGCGKSTQTSLCKAWLEELGREVLLVREPGGTKLGERIREILLDKKNSSMAPMTELFLFEAARAQIVEETIKPALAEGKVVICDRFFDSSYAYQGCARGLGPEMVSRLNMDATGGLAPDVTFFLDISVEDAVKRRNTRGEEKDTGLRDYHHLRAAYNFQSFRSRGGHPLWSAREEIHIGGRG